MFQAERAFHQGYAAWLAGDLERASERLEAASRAAPAAADPLYPMARTLSERGDREGALSTLERAVALDPRPAAPLFRGLILYDHGDAAGAREALAQVPRSNPLATALAALLSLPEGLAAGARLELPLAARWIAEASGRLLALLEEALVAKREEWLAYHHALYTGETAAATASSSPAPGGEEGSAEVPLKTEERTGEARSRRQNPRSPAGAWRAALEDAFRARAYREVEEAFTRPDVEESWPDLPAKIYRGFALLASGKEGAALRLLAEAGRDHPGEGDLHFLSGLCHTALGRRREAGWSYVRAARAMDVEVDEAAKGLLAKLDITVAWTD
jgi:tetratricopeptide (TPR) repeat protein